VVEIITKAGSFTFNSIISTGNTKSKIWESSVVFILEDDAQNGADHVDAHRSTAYVAGGYVKRKFVDHIGSCIDWFFGWRPVVRTFVR
jgi:uncharacterized RmlC-like cupin family protein